MNPDPHIDRMLLEARRIGTLASMLLEQGHPVKETVSTTVQKENKNSATIIPFNGRRR